MAPDDMPPLVVSNNRFLDIGPYCNHLRTSDPLKWGSVFPWEFPQDASRQAEESFLRKWFTEQQIHVQGGAGDPGSGFKFLKQVWYSQAIWNWEQRVPAVNDWWWKNAESALLIHDPSMQKYFLDPNVELKTFFQTKELEMYGEKFLWHVIPVIQQTARAMIEAKGTAARNAAGDKVVRSHEKVPEGASASEPTTAASEGQRGRPNLVRTTSQPAEGGHNMLSPADTARIGPGKPQSVISEVVRPRTISNESQVAIPTEEPLFQRKRGNSTNRRYSNHSGQFHSKHPHIPYGQGTMPMQNYQPGLPHPAAAYPSQTHFGFGGLPAFSPLGRGHQGPADVLLPFHLNQQYPPIDGGRHSGTFVAPLGHQQNDVVWATNSLMAQGHGSHRHASLGSRAEFGSRTRIEQVGPVYRGGKLRGFEGDRTRGRGRGHGNRSRGGRSSFGSNGQTTEKWTSGEFKAFNTNRPRRESVLSIGKNWRSGSEHPQNLNNTIQDENMAPRRTVSGYMPAPNGFPTGSHSRSTDPSPAQPPFPPWTKAANQHTQAASSFPQDPQYHCTKDSIGDRCPYVAKVAVFNVPREIDDQQITQFFGQYGNVVNVHRLPLTPPRLGHSQLPDQMVFVSFSSPDETRLCLRSVPETWLDGRSLRVEVPKEYWDPRHTRYKGRSLFSSAMPPVFDPYATFQPGIQAAAAVMHQSRDTSSAIRGPSTKLTGLESHSEETTPMASGTSTPKTKKTNRGKGKRGSEHTAASIAEAAEEKKDAELKSTKAAGSETSTDLQGDGLSTQTTAVGSPNLQLTFEKQHSVSESTERQTTPEAKLKSIDEVTTKLREPETSQAQDKKKVPAAATTCAALEAVEVQSSTEQAVESASVQLSSESSTSSTPFRNDRAKTEATATEVSAVVAKPSLQNAQSPKDSAGTPATVEEEQLEDGFHTATGLPSSSKGDYQVVRTISEAVTPTDESVQATDDQRTTPTVTAQPKHTENMGVNIEALSAAPPLTLDIVAVEKSGKRKGKGSKSSGTALDPHSAVVTVSNTSVVEQASDMSSKTTEATSAQAKKAEKQKGPAKTESLSLFGKKEKKPKQKKGALKGKLKDAPRVVSTSSNPLADTQNAPCVVEPHLQITDGNSQTFAVVSTSEGDENKVADLTGTTSTAATTRVGGSITPTTLERALLPANEELKKKKPSLFDGMKSFLGQRPHEHHEDMQGSNSMTKKSSLTHEKDPGSDAKPGETTIESVGSNRPDRITEGAAHSLALEPAHRSADRPIVKGKVSDTLSSALNKAKDDSKSLRGLWLDATDNDLLAQAGSHREMNGEGTVKKKNKRKSKNKCKLSTGDASELTPEATPVTENSPSGSGTQQLFPINFGPTASTFLGSDRSDASSTTVGEGTPSTRTSSPMVTKPRRVVPVVAQNTDNVIREKEPQWKNKKRQYRAISGVEEGDEPGKNYVADAGENGDTEERGLTFLTADKSNAVTVGAGSGLSTPRIITLPPGCQLLLVTPRPSSSDDGEEEEAEREEEDGGDSNKIVETGRVRNDFVEIERAAKEAEGENDTVKESRLKMKKLMEQESRRKHGFQGYQGREGTGTVESEGRIVELGELDCGVKIYATS